MKRLAFALALALAASRAAAAPPPDAATQSMRAHFESGVRAYDAKPPDYLRALDEFRAAYKDKPSPIIKQNIALSLRALGRHVEAIDTLREMLDEGGDAIKPTVREQAKKAIAEMGDAIATARVTIVAHAPPGAPDVHPALIVDDVLVPAAKMNDTMRFDPGEHRFRVHAEGYADAAVRVALVKGQRDVAIALELVAIPQPAPVPPAPASASTEVALAPPPPRYDALARYEPAREKEPYYGMAGLALQTQSLTLTQALDEKSPTLRRFNGASLVFHAGRRLSKYFDVGGVTELGVLSAESYDSPGSTDRVPAKTGLVNWVIAPELRAHTAGTLRLVASIALGAEVGVLGATLEQNGGSSVSRTGSGVGFVGLFEVGGQLDLGKAFVESVFFFDAHGLGSMRDGSVRGTDDRLVQEHGGTRSGFRLLVGFRF